MGKCKKKDLVSVESTIDIFFIIKLSLESRKSLERHPIMYLKNENRYVLMRKYSKEHGLPTHKYNSTVHSTPYLRIPNCLTNLALLPCTSEYVQVTLTVLRTLGAVVLKENFRFYHK